MANGSGHLSSVRLVPERAEKNRKDAARSNRETALQKKTEPANTKPEKTERKPKAEKLVWRYCGSDDLAPSFIKRRDRRCRKCFGKRYGSAARAKKARIKK